MGNTCKPMAVSFQCMTKFTTNFKKKKGKKKELVLLNMGCSRTECRNPTLATIHPQVGLQCLNSISLSLFNSSPYVFICFLKLDSILQHYITLKTLKTPNKLAWQNPSHRLTLYLLLKSFNIAEENHKTALIELT